MKVLQGIFLWQIAIMPIAAGLSLNREMKVAAAFYMGVLLTSVVCFCVSLGIKNV
jgi:hypothetical protein